MNLAFSAHCGRTSASPPECLPGVPAFPPLSCSRWPSASALAGIFFGIAGAAGLTRLLSSMLFGVEAIDPVTFISAAVVFLAVALAASYIPARRAAAVEPMAALRNS